MKKIKIIFTALLLVLPIIPISSVDASTQVFSDVPKNHSNYEDIMYLLDKEVIEPTNTYGVNTLVTREEVAVMVAKAVKLDGTQRPTFFSDVPESNPNSGYIQSAVEVGIVKGYLDDTFRPDQKVTRGHMAAFIARAFKLPKGTKTFKDVPKGHTAYEAVKQLAKADITTGYTDGTFKPSNNLTRGHLSTFLARAIRYANGETVNPNLPIGKVYPDGWTAPLLKSAWSSNSEDNVQTLENELGLRDGMYFDIHGKHGAFYVGQIGKISNDEVRMKFYGWDVKSIEQGYRIPVVALEVFKLYFGEDAKRVWNYFNANDIPEKFTANGRTVKAYYIAIDSSVVLEVGKKK